MRRTWVFVFSVCFLLLCTSGLGQSTSNESQGMQALVAEVRQLRKAVQATNGYALQAQVFFIACNFGRQPLREFRDA